MSTLPFHQVDVFSEHAFGGNPVAVVHDAQGLSDEQMAAFARWTNLSETTFLLPPSSGDADYRLRIFTPGGELPFAGHPTLGSCHGWLAAGGQPHDGDVCIQECGVGLVPIRRDHERLSFAAPPLLRTGPLDDAVLECLCNGLGITAEQVVEHQWVDNGPGWCALLLSSADAVLALTPDFGRLRGFALGVVGPCPEGLDAQFEVRAFVPELGVPEDPVTGSLNAGLAQWLIDSGRAPQRYVAAQGTALGRQGRVFVERRDGSTWIGGHTVTRISGKLTI